jgi:hypothetical protein
LSFTLNPASLDVITSIVVDRVERINGEFRRRTKTQASLPGEDAVLLLLYGLLRSGQIVLRRIDGREDMPKPKSQLKAA